jgi:hypothetical protein
MLVGLWSVDVRIEESSVDLFQPRADSDLQNSLICERCSDFRFLTYIVAVQMQG